VKPGVVLETVSDTPLQPAMSNDRAFSVDSVVVGRSPRMRAVFDFVRVIADSESNVLIVGETGAGKELVANLIHHSGRRRRRPFVAVSCAILTETLIESELFGHERGAFTGAIKDRPGRFELAEGGTIFLDDIDDVPASMQVKLLRVLQQRTVERVGGTRSIPVDVRVITGSKRSLKQLVAEGRFREDLYYRLNVVPIWLPPLRERREDIPLLTDHFMRRFFKQKGESVPVLSQTVREAFQRYPWPGNVRELENACERIAQTCTCSQVRCGCMPESILFHTQMQTLPAPIDHPSHPAAVSLDERLQEVESHLITWALKVSHGNKSKAAELLQIKRSTLGDRIRKLGLAADGGDDAEAGHATNQPAGHGSSGADGSHGSLE
jgi:two-component system response regulator AtoC